VESQGKTDELLLKQLKTCERNMQELKYMTTKPPLQKILQGILHTENESKQNHERMDSTKPQENKRQESRG
jgi:hypothetical protein